MDKKPTAREKRRDRLIADIMEDWSPQDREFLIDKIQYGGLLQEAKEIKKTQTITYQDVAEEVAARRALFNKPAGYGTGVEVIDRMTYGLREGEVIILAGPSSHGKTAIALNMATNFVQETTQKILFISMEMTDMEIFERVDHIATNPDLIGDKFIVQQDRNVTASNINAIIEAHPEVKVVFIDHLHMMTRNVGARSAYDAVNECMRAVKLMALQHNKPVVLLSHVRKERSGKSGQATVADLKDSSAIEQDADFVIMINADADDRRLKQVTLGKSRTRRTVGEGTTMPIYTDGLKIITQHEYMLMKGASR